MACGYELIVKLGGNFDFSQIVIFANQIIVVELALEQALFACLPVSLSSDYEVLIDAPHGVRAAVIQILSLDELPIFGREDDVGIYLANPISFFLNLALNLADAQSDQRRWHADA